MLPPCYLLGYARVPDITVSVAAFSIFFLFVFSFKGTFHPEMKILLLALKFFQRLQITGTNIALFPLLNSLKECIFRIYDILFVFLLFSRRIICVSCVSIVLHLNCL